MYNTFGGINLEIIKIAEIINKNGGRLYYVGGYVRDKLMGQEPKDIDFCIVNLSPDKFSDLFPKAFSKGAFFPVFQLDGNEFAFARKETKNSAGHTGFSYDINNITLEEDLFRRDVTINSMAIDVLTDELIDPFGGKNDLDKKILRATSTHFSEDPLRVYRVAQFSSRFNFSISDDTKLLMKEMKSELLSLSSERVFEELRKALKSNTPSRFFEVLRELNLLDIHFREIFELIGVIQPEIYHPEGDAYTHSLIVLDKVAQKTTDEKTRFSALLHDLGKAKTPKDILPHHYGHDKIGEQPVRDLCNRLKTPTAWKKLAVVIATEHMKAGIFNKMSYAKKVSFIEKNIKYLDELEIIAKIDSKNNSLNFAKIGKKMFNEVNGDTVDLPNNFKAKELLHSARVSWLKHYFPET